MNVITSRSPLAARSPIQTAIMGGAALTQAFARAFHAFSRMLMNPQPFPVRHPNPDFVIIIFIGGDNDLTEMVDIHLRQMERGVGAGIAVLAVTDEFMCPAQVVEVSAGTRTVLEELGEINTGDPGTLSTLLARALVSYPSATRFAIGFSDHGSGIFNEPLGAALHQPSPAEPRPQWRLTHALPAGKLFRSVHAATLFDTDSKDMLTNREAGKMLRDAFAAAGRREKVDLIFSDTCLDGMIEVATELAPFARCTVASEEVEPSNGWDYSEWLSRTNAAPPVDAEAWGRQAVEAMKATYRDRPAEFPVTLSAVRSSNCVARAFANFVVVARGFGQDGFTRLAAALPYTKIFGRRIDSYDLCGFARHLAECCDIPEIAAAARALFAATNAAVLLSIELGDDVVAAAHGIAFWFPNSRESLDRIVPTYRELRFEALTGWSAYLHAYR